MGVALRLLLEREGPKPGTVAWHKKEYLANRFPITFIDRVENKWAGLRGQPPSKDPTLMEIGRFHAGTHARALEKLGYLKRRRLAFKQDFDSNGPSQRLWAKAEKTLPKSHIWWMVDATFPDSGYDLLYERRDETRWEALIAEVNAKTK